MSHNSIPGSKAFLTIEGWYIVIGNPYIEHTFIACLVGSNSIART